MKTPNGWNDENLKNYPPEDPDKTDYGKYALIFISSAILILLLGFTHYIMTMLLIFVSPVLYFLSIGFAGAGIATGNGSIKSIIALSTAVLSSIVLFYLASTI